MCVGLPARVVTIKNGMALVDASGLSGKFRRRLSPAWIREIM